MHFVTVICVIVLTTLISSFGFDLSISFGLKLLFQFLLFCLLRLVVYEDYGRCLWFSWYVGDIFKLNNCRALPGVVNTIFNYVYIIFTITLTGTIMCSYVYDFHFVFKCVSSFGFAVCDW